MNVKIQDLVFHKYREMIPEWALDYLVNGNDELLTKADRNEADDFLESFHKAHKNVVSIEYAPVVYDYDGNEIDSDEERYQRFEPQGCFTWSPAFGEPTNCYEYQITVICKE